MASVLIAPAKPPPPTPLNLPFQFCSGSQVSKPICESAVGRITPTTRQYGGSGPPVTGAASVSVVSGRCRLARLAHAAGSAAAAWVATPEISAAEAARTATLRLIGFPPQEVAILTPSSAEAAMMERRNAGRRKPRRNKAACGRDEPSAHDHVGIGQRIRIRGVIALVVTAIVDGRRRRRNVLRVLLCLELPLEIADSVQELLLPPHRIGRGRSIGRFLRDDDFHVLGVLVRENVGI